MISMGSSSSSICDDGGVAGQCSGVSVEGLLLEGNSQSIHGIVNQNSGAASYVDHVNLHFIEGIGLTVSGSQTQDSGPYANLACATGSSYVSTTSCVEFDASSTRGLHGVTCTAGSTSSSGPTAAITLDSNYNTLEDIHTEGFQDGVLIGSASTAEGDTILSVNGAGGSGIMTNVVHISSSKGVTDLAIFGAAGYFGMYGLTNTIKDEQNVTNLPISSNPIVGEYILGDLLASTTTGGQNRLTNSSGLAPAWGFAGAVPGSSACALGSIYSNTSGSSGTIFYVCTYNGTSNVWTAKN